MIIRIQVRINRYFNNKILNKKIKILYYARKNNNK